VIRGIAVVLAVTLFGTTNALNDRSQSENRLHFNQSDDRLWFPPTQPAIFVLPDGSRRTVRSLLSPLRRFRYGDFVWNDTGVVQGPVWIRVDLTQQLISVFMEGQEIGSAVILYGTDGKPTPYGIFHVKARAQKHMSSLYNAPMPYMLRLTDDGVAIHASAVRSGSATHGCVGVPIEFARHLFARVRVGSQVVIVA
jgi:hypothetical protein